MLQSGTTSIGSPNSRPRQELFLESGASLCLRWFLRRPKAESLRGRIWNRRNVSCPPSGFNRSGREWAELVVFRLDPGAKVEHYNSSPAGGNRSNIHDRWLCHPSSIPMLAPPSHRFLFLKETGHKANRTKPRLRFLKPTRI